MFGPAIGMVRQRRLNVGVDGGHGGIQWYDLRVLSFQARKRLVDDDPHQPGREPGLGTKVLQGAPGAQIGFLKRVLGLRVALQDAARGAEQQAVVAPHDRLESRFVAQRRARHELGVFGLRRNGRWRLVQRVRHMASRASFDLLAGAADAVVINQCAAKPAAHRQAEEARRVQQQGKRVGLQRVKFLQPQQQADGE
ncbi:hypothetical protein D3C85_1191000 [compost metagenome]